MNYLIIELVLMVISNFIIGWLLLNSSQKKQDRLKWEIIGLKETIDRLIHDKHINKSRIMLLEKELEIKSINKK